MIHPSLVPRAAVTVMRTFGARGAALRALHEARLRAGAFRAAPRHPPAGGAPPESPFRVDAARLAAAVDPELARRRAERVARGEYPAFRAGWRRFPDDAAGWLRDPVGGGAYDGEAPWWKVRHLGAGGDIKDLWEPARFGWAFDLVRGYLAGGDLRFARAFHERLAQWAESSPPFRGPHWSCGQEAAVRAVALLYAEANLPPAGVPGAERRLAAVLAASGERVADAIGYAESQRNNHGISEAVGLVMLGARFRGSHPEAERWLRAGRRSLETMVREQFAGDGWYIQHSFTYLRLALDQCVVAQRVLRALGETLSPLAVERFRAAVGLLGEVMEPESGEVPNHGANDGAFVHPVTSAEYRDFRPVLTAACATFGFPLPGGVRPDAETLAWLGLPAPEPGPPRRDGVRAGKSGWVVARAGPVSVFLRAGRYTSRPTHLDPLHLDVRCHGREVVVDPGSFSYNSPPPWRNGLVSAHVHNGPVLDGAEPGIRGPRFLWLSWPESDVVEAAWRDGTATLVAEIPGRVRRTVRVTAAGVRVEDEAIAARCAELRVRWLLHPDADLASVEVEGGAELLHAREGATAGWFSPHYGERVASRCLEARREGGAGTRVVTHIRPAPSLAHGPARAAAAAGRG